MAPGDDAQKQAAVRAATGRDMPSTRRYVGLSLSEAQTLAHEEGRELRVQAQGQGRRSNLRPKRVNITMADDGLVNSR